MLINMEKPEESKPLKQDPGYLEAMKRRTGTEEAIEEEMEL
jgi:hypothetical protein